MEVLTREMCGCCRGEGIEYNPQWSYWFANVTGPIEEREKCTYAGAVQIAKEKLGLEPPKEPEQKDCHICGGDGLVQSWIDARDLFRG